MRFAVGEVIVSDHEFSVSPWFEFPCPAYQVLYKVPLGKESIAHNDTKEKFTAVNWMPV